MRKEKLFFHFHLKKKIIFHSVIFNEIFRKIYKNFYYLFFWNFPSQFSPDNKSKKIFNEFKDDLQIEFIILMLIRVSEFSTNSMFGKWKFCNWNWIMIKCGKYFNFLGKLFDLFVWNFWVFFSFLALRKSGKIKIVSDNSWKLQNVKN